MEYTVKRNQIDKNVSLVRGMPGQITADKGRRQRLGIWLEKSDFTNETVLGLTVNRKPCDSKSIRLVDPNISNSKATWLCLPRQEHAVVRT